MHAATVAHMQVKNTVMKRIGTLPSNISLISKFDAHNIKPRTSLNMNIHELHANLERTLHSQHIPIVSLAASVVNPHCIPLVVCSQILAIESDVLRCLF